MKRYLKKYGIFLVFLVCMLLLLWGGVRMNKDHLQIIDSLMQENRELREDITSSESGGLLKEFRFGSCGFDSKRDIIPLIIGLTPREVSPTTTASIVFNGTELTLSRDKWNRNAFYTELEVPVTESNVVSSVTLKDGQRTESVETHWIVHPWELLDTRVEAYPEVSADLFQPSQDGTHYFGDIEYRISDYAGGSIATLLKIVNGAVVEEKQVTLKQEGRVHTTHSPVEVESSEDIKTEYVLHLVTGQGFELRHTGLEVDGRGMEHFTFNAKTEVYNAESGKFLFEIP